MKATCLATALYFMISCGTLLEAGRLLSQERPIPVVCFPDTGACNPSGFRQVSSEVIQDATEDIITALATATSQLDANGQVQNSVDGFTNAVAQAFATMISQHLESVSVSVEIDDPCVFARTTASETIPAIAGAVGRAFSYSSNEFFRYAPGCFSSATSHAAAFATHSAAFSICVGSSTAPEFFLSRIEATDFIENLSVVFNNVVTARANEDITAAARCSTPTL